MRVVDSHFHLWQLSQVSQPWIDPESMGVLNRDYEYDDYATALAQVLAPVTSPTDFESAESALIQAGSSADPSTEAAIGSVLVQTIVHPLETDIYLAIANNSPLISGVVGWCDLSSPTLAGELARLRSLPGGHRLKGIRHQIQDEPEAGSLESEPFRAGLRLLGSEQLTFDLIVRADQIPYAAGVVAAQPETRFVLDHAGKPALSRATSSPAAFEAWQNAITDLAASPNAYVKWSGLSTEADWDSWITEDLRPVWKHLVASFGPHRMMWGSDWPVVEVSGGVSRWVTATQELASSLSAAGQRAFWHGTAIEFYGL